MRFDLEGKQYEILFGSDVGRDGAYVELNALGPRLQLAEHFQSDVDFLRTRTIYDASASPGVLERLSTEADQWFRTRLVGALVNGEVSPSSVREALVAFGWDCTDELVVLKRENVANILDRFLAGLITADQVSEWADALECRDDVGFVANEKDLLKDMLFKLANPQLHGSLTLEMAGALRALLGEGTG